MHSNNASSENYSCSSGISQGDEDAAPINLLGALPQPPLSLRQMLLLPEQPSSTVEFWIDDTDGTVTTRLPQFHLSHSSGLVQHYQYRSDDNCMVHLRDILNEAIDICIDMESIITSDNDGTTHPSTSHGEAKQ